MPRLTPPDHSYFDSVSTQLELSVGRSCAGVVSNAENNVSSGVFLGLDAGDTGLTDERGKSLGYSCKLDLEDDIIKILGKDVDQKVKRLNKQLISKVKRS